MFKIYDGRNEFYQWDTERKLIVNDASITEVHFSDAVDNEALVCQVYEFEGVRVADVPNILLQTEWKVNAYAFTDKHTKVSASFKVLPRSKPSDYVYTETEVKTYEEIIEKVNSLPFKELKVSEGNYRLQELEEGIYTVVQDSTGAIVNVLLGTNTNKLTMKQGSFLIVSNNYTINNVNRSFKKHFIAVIAHSVPNTCSLKCGELYCKSITVDGVKDWEYTVTWGDLIHSGNVGDYVTSGSGGITEITQETYLGDLTTGIYKIDCQDESYCLWLDDSVWYGLYSGIAIVNYDETANAFEWMIIGRDSNWSEGTQRGRTHWNIENEYWECISFGIVESDENKVSSLNNPNAISVFKYPSTRAVVDYVESKIKPISIDVGSEHADNEYYNANAVDAVLIEVVGLIEEFSGYIEEFALGLDALSARVEALENK